MFYHAKNGNITIGATDLDYVSFGTGEKNLVMIPGLGDALKTVKGAALSFALMYRLFAKDYTVYLFSRKNKLEKDSSTQSMAADQALAMQKLGIDKAAVLGVSEGGMIAQHLAADFPERVEKLVLAVTLCRQNETVQQVIGNWIRLAKANDFRRIFIDTAEKTYSEKRLARYRPLYPILTRLSRPQNLDRFLIQANACIRHDALDKLQQITCPTLIIGGGQDKIVGTEAAKELSEAIAGSRLLLYPALGHGAYEEAEDFNRRVLDFLKEENATPGSADLVAAPPAR